LAIKVLSESGALLIAHFNNFIPISSAKPAACSTELAGTSRTKQFFLSRF
jgi:hypothetical protein